MTGRSDEWFTPPEIFEALGETFDLDVSQPETGREYLSVPCRRFLTMKNDGLSNAWDGFVWMNPPFGGAQWRRAMAGALHAARKWDCLRICADQCWLVPRLHAQSRCDAFPPRQDKIHQAGWLAWERAR
ncbi:DNA N-6-adenine-methyltransferase [Novacetimonas hansenii]|uniref:DNA N-6-adenine-methyltransferase n=1 Tax=Novacetimonas hansenii TaxID=436 RepID=UPI0038D13ED5